MRLALLSLVESIRNNPDKYSSLIYYNDNISSTQDYNSQYYSLYNTYGFYMYKKGEQYQSPILS
jgi:hypothetical protein